MPKLTVLTDNATSDQRLSSQHGLSLWLEADSSRVLFDTGRDELFLENARVLGIPVSTPTHLVLSHGHYDHAGGVPALLEQGSRPQVIVGPDAWARRRSSHPIGIPWPQELLGDLPISVNHDSLRVEPGIIAANVGGTRDAAARHPGLQRSVNGHWEPDTFPDEQILVMHTVEGLVVITGCTHCGVDALIRCVRRTAGDTPVYAIIGGLHLGASPREGILDAAVQLRDIEHVWVNHCTGTTAYSILCETLGPRVEWAGAGFQATLPPMDLRTDPC